MTARTKILAGFGIVIVALIVLSWRGAAGLQGAEEAFDSVDQNQFQPYARISEARLSVLAIRGALLEHFMSSDLGRKRELEAKITAARSVLDENMKWLRESEATADERERFNEIQDEYDRTGQVRLRAYELSAAGRPDEGMALMTAAYIPGLDSADGKMAELGNQYLDEASAVFAANKNDFRQANTQSLVVAGIGVAVAALIVFVIYRLLMGLKAAIY